MIWTTSSPLIGVGLKRGPTGSPLSDSIAKHSRAETELAAVPLCTSSLALVSIAIRLNRIPERIDGRGVRAEHPVTSRPRKPRPIRAGFSDHSTKRSPDPIPLRSRKAAKRRIPAFRSL